MIEIEMNQDLGAYSPKLIGPLTTRQVVCFVPAAIVAVVIYNVFHRFLPWVPSELANFLIFIPAVPAAFFGMMKPYGMLPEVWLKSVFVTAFLAPPKRRLVGYNQQEVLLTMLANAPAEDEQTSKGKKAKKAKQPKKKKYRPSKEAVL